MNSVKKYKSMVTKTHGIRIHYKVIREIVSFPFQRQKYFTLRHHDRNGLLLDHSLFHTHHVTCKVIVCELINHGINYSIKDTSMARRIVNDRHSCNVIFV